MHKQILAATLAVLAAGTGAQPVWRCGNSYQQKPCAGGTPVDVADPDSAAAAARARAAVQSDLRAAAALQKARLDAEKNAAKAVVIGAEPKPPASAPRQADKPRKKPKEPEHFTAAAPKK